MPRGDQTGPAGYGSMTGRQMGYCAGYDRPGFANSGFGGGRRGFRAARGYGYRRFNQPNYSYQEPANEEELLKNDAKILKSELEKINNRLEELNKE